MALPHYKCQVPGKPLPDSDVPTSGKKARPAALKMRVSVLLDLRLCCYFISTIQTSFNNGAITFKGASLTTEIK